jgi:hypothetical protein
MENTLVWKLVLLSWRVTWEDESDLLSRLLDLRDKEAG